MIEKMHQPIGIPRLPKRLLRIILVCSLALTVFTCLVSCSVSDRVQEAQAQNEIAQHGVDIANAAAICGAINVFNSLQESDNSKILSVPPVEELKKKLDQLWPADIDDTDADRALLLITISDEGTADTSMKD